MHFIDDHEMVAIDISFHKNVSVLKETFIRIKKDMNAIGRFRPVYHLHRALEVKVFGTNFKAISVYLAALNGIISFLLFFFMLRAGFNLIEALAFTLVTMVGPQSETWWMLGTNEPIGMFFLASALLLIIVGSRSATGWRAWALLAVSIILTTLSKESFILTVPALLFLVICLYAWYRKINLIDALFRFLPLIIILYVVMLAELYLVKQDKLDYAGYSNKVPASQYISTLTGILTRDNYLLLLLAETAVLLVVTAFAFFAPRMKKLLPDQATGNFIIAGIYFIFGVLIFVPQVVVYTKSGFFGRYYLPLMLGQAMLLVVPLYLIRKTITNRILLIGSYGFCVAGIAFFIARNFNSVTQASQGFAQTGRTIQEVFAVIDEKADTGGKILMVTGPASYESIASVEVYLQHILKKPNPLYFFFTDKPSFPVKKKHRFENIKTTTDIEVIVILHGLEYQFLQLSADWFDPSRFQFKEIGSFVIYYR